MASDLSSDLDDFKTFVMDRLVDFENVTLEVGLEEFRKYQRELANAREKLCEAESQSTAGMSGPLDVESLKRDVRKRLAQDGITE